MDSGIEILQGLYFSSHILQRLLWNHKTIKEEIYVKLINKLRYYYWVKVCARDMVKYSKKVLFTKVDKTSEGYYAYITKMGYHRKMMFHAKNLMTGEVSDSWSVCSFEEI